MKDDIAKYYADRAAEYDLIYQKPERQADLRKMEKMVGDKFKGLDVLEIACGTGYWTQFISKRARSILAIDNNVEMMNIAVNRGYGKCKVLFKEADAYSLQGVSGNFNAGFCGFWYSHVPITRIAGFLKLFHSHLLSGSKVIMIDNLFVPGSSTPISRQDGDGNTYQKRKLDNGTEYEIMKNFPGLKNLEDDLSDFTAKPEITFLDYYWAASYLVK